MFIISTYKRAQAMNYPTETDNANKAATYNGWSNYETWNVALYMDNDFGSYQVALNSKNFKEYRNQVIGVTPDQVSLFSAKLNIQELDEKIQELQS